MKVIDGVRTYGSEDEALRRVDSLIVTEGIWPAVVRIGKRWRLTVDPDNARERGPEVQVPDVEAEYQEDIDHYDWLTDDLESSNQ